MRASRRQFVIEGGASLALGYGIVRGSRAQEATFSYRFGNNWPATHSVNVRISEALDRIRQESNGRLDIKLFPNGQLGGDQDLISQVRSGGIEFTLITNVILGTLVPVASLPNMGFAFPDYAAVWKAMDGPLGQYLRSSIEAANLHAFEKIWDNGYRQTTNRLRPIENLNDLAGLKVRVPPSPVLISLFQSLGASPGGLSFNEVYMALQTGLFDGQENPLAIVDSGKLYEVQKYCAMTNHMWDGAFGLANMRAWKSLPGDLQEIATRAFADATLKQREDNKNLNDSLRAKLAGLGMSFSTPDLGPFRDRLKTAGFYGHWSQKFGTEAWSILEGSTGRLT